MVRNTSHLPHEIIEIILSKLPIKPLLRFKSVSKSWNTIISDPVFVENHIRRSKRSNPDNLFLCHDNFRLCSSNRFSVVKFEDRKLRTLKVFECTYAWEECLCFYEGVILIATDVTYTRFTLWNPSTRAHATLSHSYSCHHAAFGLCRDPITNDFKVVIVDSDHYSVYSCKNKSWTTVHKAYAGPRPLAYYQSRGVCVDGTSYWVSRLWPQIMYFDPRDDELKIMRKPNYVDDSKSFYLVDLGGSLCMYCWKMGRYRNTVQIWTKEKGIDGNSWTELMAVENVNMSIWRFQPICFVGNKIVIRNRGFDRLVVYNPCEKRFEDFEGDTRVLRNVFVPIPYMESMFSPL
ncbi:hypothetical protein ABFX02_14G056600 [Erythranthe guttata]